MGLSRFFLVLLFLIIGSSAFRIENKSNRKPVEEIKQTEGSTFGELDILHDRVSKCTGVLVQKIQIDAKNPNGKRYDKLLYTVTYDLTKKAARLSKQDVIYNKSPERKSGDPFLADFLCDDVKTIDKLYEGKTAKDNLYKLLDTNIAKNKNDKNRILLAQLINTWFQTTTKGLARGHLTPFADMENRDEALATNKYINVAPQWGNFNSVNWSQIEKNVRESLPKGVTTGTFGILKVLGVEMYLRPDKTYELPQYFWKLVCPKVGPSFFIIGINFIFDEKFFGGGVTYDKLAKEVCSKPITNGNVFLPKNPTTIEYGYTFVCDPNNVKKTDIKKQTC